jgi:hypothetical protein
VHIATNFPKTGGFLQFGRIVVVLSISGTNVAVFLELTPSTYMPKRAKHVLLASYSSVVVKDKSNLLNLSGFDGNHQCYLHIKGLCILSYDNI